MNNDKACSFVKTTASISLVLTVIYLFASIIVIALQGTLAPALMGTPKDLGFVLPFVMIINIVLLGAVNFGFCISALNQNGKRASIVGFIIPLVVYVLLDFMLPMLSGTEIFMASKGGVNALSALTSLNSLLSFFTPLISAATILTASAGAARYIKDLNSSSVTEDENI